MAGLSVAPAAGEQGGTQNPQTVPTQTVGPSARSGGVQPGTSTSLLTSQQGVGLGNTALTTVRLDGSPSSARTQTQSKAKPDAGPAQHVNAAWLIVPIVFVLLAAGMFWSMTRSAKSTTN